MYFLIGLGIILAIVYGNMLFDYIRNKKAQKQHENEPVTEVSESMETAAGRTPVRQEESLPSIAPVLAGIIEQKLKQKQNIFGLPLTLCESDGQGKLTALDQEDNIYMIETVVRHEYEDMQEQVMADMAAAKSRIREGGTERRVYAIVCTDQMTDALKAFAEAERGVRLFGIDVMFYNIV